MKKNVVAPLPTVPHINTNFHSNTKPLQDLKAPKYKSSNKLQDLIKKTNKKDVVFYEYEITNKKVQEKLARRQARRYGLCLCSRWFFLMAGNMILITIICSTCAILLYVNTAVVSSSKPLTYGQSCVVDTNNCNALQNLYCSASICKCISNMIWNGTDCICATNQYWDGLACLWLSGYQQSCSSTSSCYQIFSCDSSTKTCLCPSTSSSYYTKFYTGDVDDLYGFNGGTCTNKLDYQVDCSGYGEYACKEYLGLTCSYGNLNTLQCVCNTGYYWNGAACVPQIVVEGGSCALNTLLACSSSVSLVCNSVDKKCYCSNSNNYYFNTQTNTCTLKGGYMEKCLGNTWCNATIGLNCYTGSTACNCPLNKGTYVCDCSIGSYWDGQQCSALVTQGNPCPGTYACTTGYTCIYGYCL